MSAPITVTSSSKLIADRLFGGNQSQLTTWMQQTQARTEAITDSIKPELLPSHPSPSDDTAFEASINLLCEKVNNKGFALYEWCDEPDDTTRSVVTLLQTLSLNDSDQGVIRESETLSLLQDLTGTPKGRFPPYQSKAMNWHTDGYYNDADETIRSFTLHCVAPATNGGTLLLMDDTFLVFALWQENPELVALLSHPEAMTLPRNKDNEGHDRPDRSVPVILQNADNSITMRFTTRTQHIQWRCDATQAAAQRASELINAHTEWHTRVTLQKGQGIITRNVLHAREQFADAPDKPKRQMLRGRFTSLPKPATTVGSAQALREI